MPVKCGLAVQIKWKCSKNYHYEIHSACSAQSRLSMLIISVYLCTVLISWKITWFKFFLSTSEINDEYLITLWTHHFLNLFVCFVDLRNRRWHMDQQARTRLEAYVWLVTKCSMENCTQWSKYLIYLLLYRTCFIIIIISKCNLVWSLRVWFAVVSITSGSK